MTTVTYPQTLRPAGRPALLLFLAVAILAAGLLSGVSYAVFTQHAMTSHARHVPEIENCFENGGQLSPWLQGPDGRFGRYCLENGRAYWRIAECEGGTRVIVTQFKQELRRLAKYIVNKGYSPVEAIPCT